MTLYEFNVLTLEETLLILNNYANFVQMENKKDLQSLESHINISGPTWARTMDPLIMSQVL